MARVGFGALYILPVISGYMVIGGGRHGGEPVRVEHNCIYEGVESSQFTKQQQLNQLRLALLPLNCIAQVIVAAV